MSDYTPGPWILATSCSWRRILTRDGSPVIVPTNHPIDRHPDLSGREEDMELAARAPELLAELERARVEIEELRDILRRIQSEHGIKWREYQRVVPTKEYADPLTGSLINAVNDAVSEKDGD